MSKVDPSGLPVIILDGQFAGREGVCLGKGPEDGKWAVSPDESDAVVYLRFESEFGVLLNEGQDPAAN